MSKRSQYSAKTTLAAADIMTLLDSADSNKNKKITVQNLLTALKGLDYKRYIATVSQSATNAPVVTVIENTLGAPIVWAYTATGEYTGTLTGAFTAGKTVCFKAEDDAGYNMGLYASDTDHLFMTTDVAGTPANNWLNGASIEVRVYP